MNYCIYPIVYCQAFYVLLCYCVGMEIFFERLKELRIERGITQAQLSKATGLSRSVIGYWEGGKKRPTSTAIITLAKFFGVTSDYLLGLSDC